MTANHSCTAKQEYLTCLLPLISSRLSEELPLLPHTLCILTNRLCNNLGWRFLGQLSLMEWAPWPHRSCHRHRGLQDLEVLLLPKVHIQSIASGRSQVWAGAPIFASLSPIRNTRLHCPLASSSPQTPLHTQGRAHASAALLIHTDLWVSRKASLITLADFQVLFCLNNVFRNPVPCFSVVIT